MNPQRQVSGPGLLRAGLVVAIMAVSVTACATDQNGVAAVAGTSAISTDPTSGGEPALDQPSVPGSVQVAEPGGSSGPTSPVALPGSVTLSVPNEAPPTDGPGAQATPILWISSGSGYWCRDANGENRLPDLVVYSDFSALRVENLAQGCAVDPMVTIGWVDPAKVVELVTLFQSAGLGGADLDNPNVIDAGTTYVTVNIGGTRTQAAVVGLSVDGAPADQDEQRKALTAIRSGLMEGFNRTGAWAPDRLVVAPLRGESVSRPGGAVTPWPSVDIGQGCTPIPDEDVQSVLEAAGGYPFPSWWWKVGGVETELVIGVVLPGFAPCTRAPLG